MNIKDKVVLITGASSGIGKATAILFAKHGAKIILTARRIEVLNEIKNSINKFNQNCLAIKADITKEKDIENLFIEINKTFGQIDIVINNAGTGLKKPLLEISLDEWESTMSTNMTSVFLCTKEAAKYMVPNKSGQIITVSSVAGLYGMPPYSAYCASKHAVTGFMRVMFWELRRHKIKISTIYPMRVKTEFFKDYKIKPKNYQMLSPNDIADYIYAIAKKSKLKQTYVLLRNTLKRFLSCIIRK